jgi:hypothetical protein
MQKGEVYVCEKCGVALQVLEECKDCGKPEEECECPPCTFSCCGEELTKRA